MLNDATRKVKIKHANSVLKNVFQKQYEKEMWKIYRKDKSVIEWIKAPTKANLEKWLKVWGEKLTFKDIDHDYFEYVKGL
jgi:hypothetical protein